MVMVRNRVREIWGWDMRCIKINKRVLDRLGLSRTLSRSSALKWFSGCCSPSVLVVAAVAAVAAVVVTASVPAASDSTCDALLDVPSVFKLSFALSLILNR